MVFFEAHCSELVPGPKHQYVGIDNRMSCRNISLLLTHIKNHIKPVTCPPCTHKSYAYITKKITPNYGNM